MQPGTDLIEIKRLIQAMERQPRLKKRLFTAREIEECEAKGNSAASFAGRFAAKEAIMKCLGTGLRGFKFTDIEIIGNSLGRPEVLLFGPALDIARKQGLLEVKVSISHTRELALAFAVGLTEGENDK